MNDDFTIGYFGPPQLRKHYERQVDTPVGQPCLLCDEAVRDGDSGTVDPGGRVMHYECVMRASIGSVGHQLRRCSCYNKLDPQEDPPGMSRRQAAIAACALWHATHPLPTHGDDHGHD